MSVSVTLPALGESVTEGTVTRWLKHVGDSVQADEPLLEVSTDKVDTEIPAPASGTLLQITVGEDETVAVGAELGVIGADSEQTGGETAEPSQPESADGAQAQGQADRGYQSNQADQAEQADQQPQADERAPADDQPQPASSDAPPSAPADANGQGTSVTLPALGESVTEGTVTRWLKQVGDTVQVDEPLLEVSTDKVDTEIPAPTSGTLVEITVGEDETVAVGAELGVIAGETAAAPRHAAPAEPAARAEPEPSGPAPEPQARQQDRQPQQAQPQQAQPQQAQPQEQPRPQPQRTAEPAREQAPSGDQAAAQYVTPLVRKLASDHQVDLSTVTGTGVGGRIRKQDVLDAARARESAATQTQQGEAAPSATAAPAQPSPLRGTTEKLSRPRRVIAQRVYESLQSTAQLTTVVEVDVTAIARIRDRAKRAFEQREGVKLSFLPFFAKASLEALKEHPKLNATLDVDKGEVTYHGTENLVIAVDTDRGLMVPVIHDAGDLSVTGLARRITDLAERTRINKITPDEISGGTFTITNTGSRGALFDTPIFFQPQVAILGTGAVVKRPVVVDTPLGETIAVRHMVYLALSYDHRLIDGADAARFLVAVKRRLEDGSVAAEFAS